MSVIVAKLRPDLRTKAEEILAIVGRRKGKTKFADL